MKTKRIHYRFLKDGTCSFGVYIRAKWHTIAIVNLDNEQEVKKFRAYLVLLKKQDGRSIELVPYSISARERLKMALLELDFVICT